VPARSLNEKDRERISHALEWLEANVREQPTLEDLAAELGLSRYHLQRLFTRWAGISPKRFLQSLTVARARALLRDSQPILDASFESGLSSPGRLHDLFVHVEAMTPGEYKELGAGLSIRYGRHESPFGPCLIAMTDRGVCALEFLGSGMTGPGAEGTWSFRDALSSLQKHWAYATFVEDPEAIARTGETVFDRSVEADGRGELRLHLKGTNFQVQVWRALLRVPEGCVVDYGGLARRLGKPTAARAVATAVGDNPVSVIIPCHRVLRRHGELGGYRWGLQRKLALLGWELARDDHLSIAARSSDASAATSLSG
jgi:AraC family transcriptional regulator of adaptative response/methylated-DNA-[protein]-cysteine methyltransferase